MNWFTIAVVSAVSTAAAVIEGVALLNSARGNGFRYHVWQEHLWAWTGITPIKYHPNILSPGWTLLAARGVVVVASVWLTLAAIYGWL